MQNLKEILNQKFGLEDFREGQIEIIESVINKNDTLVFMPTGGGKSLIYQFSGICLQGLVIVISPLISLMKDQVDKLNSLGIRSELVNSTITNNEKQNILNEISLNSFDKVGEIKFLYIAPERLNDEMFLNIITNVNIALIAIDEAHCISQWGHDFRPSYLKIKDFIKRLRIKTPIPAFPLQGERSFNEKNPSEFFIEGERNNIFLNYEESPEYILGLLKELRQKQTKSEEILWEVLRKKSLNGIKFRRQHPFGRYIADFYSDELKLVIELDGKVHEFQKQYDEIRDEIIQNYGVTILRFKNDEIENDLFSVIQKILNFPSPGRGGARGGVPFPEVANGGVPLNEYARGVVNKTSFPIVALTATATKKVRVDIVERLGISANNTFTSGFDRKNLIYIVREISKDAEKLAKVLEIIKKTPPYGIVYCSSVKAVSKVYQYLIENGVKVGIYNGEMKSDLREIEQNAFMTSEYDVMVATNAFGMGIDKRDIRYVIHYNLPGSIENYYQEAGRAGRDGKTSYSIIIASYQDTIIQEFFIENTYPPKEDILKLYDYLYHDFKIGDGKGNQILKTYNSIAIQSDLKSDMKVGSIIKILEKYNIVKRGFDAREGEVDFRGRGITLLLDKMPHLEIPILWNHQNVLKDESYFKLEQVKKLLFKPGCRKKFILEYFGDEEDIKKLSENCGMCDFCLDKKKFETSEAKEVIPHNVFFLILEFIKRFDDKFGAQILAGILVGSKEKKILEWNLDTDKDYSILEVYNKEIVINIFDELLNKGFLYKSFGQYPKIGITQKGLETIFDNSIFLLENNSIQASLYSKIKSYANALKVEKKEKESSGTLKIKVDKIDTYTLTLEMLNAGDDLKSIATKRDLGITTIESHLIKLYEYSKLSLADIMKYSTLEKLKNIKNIIIEQNLDTSKLSPIKEKLPTNYSYLDLKIAIAMIEKEDL